jgi:uncharacterized Zn finger protein
MEGLTAPGINPKDTVEVTCEQCKSNKFTEVVFIRKASKLLTGTANDSYIPIPTFQCASCGHINKEFIVKF